MLDITNENTWNGIEIILICHFNRKSNVLKQRLKQCCYLNLSEIHNIEVYSMKCFWILNETSLIENWSVVWCLLLHWCWWDLERKEQSKLMISLVCTLIALICKYFILRLDQIEFWARLFSRILELLIFHRYLISRHKDFLENSRVSIFVSSMKKWKNSGDIKKKIWTSKWYAYKDRTSLFFGNHDNFMIY